MSVTVKASEIIDRPVSDVFCFTAMHHVRNHPRWDSNVQLEQVSEGPFAVGTVIDRVNSRSGTPVKGTMKVVELERDEAIGMVIHDGPVEMRSRATYEARSPSQTLLTFHVELPAMDASMDTISLHNAMQQSLRHIKQIVESE
jgi:argininosuccinate synthase